MHARVETLEWLASQLGESVPLVADRFGWTPLHAAATTGRLDVGRALGPLDPAALDAATGVGKTALHLAAEVGALGIAEYLVDRGADRGQRDAHGRVPADYAERPELEAFLRRGTGTARAAPIALPPPEAAQEEPPVVRLDLSPLYPAPGSPLGPHGLELAVWSDGVVVFAADADRPEKGARIGRVAPQDVALLVRELEESGLLELPDRTLGRPHGAYGCLTVAHRGRRARFHVEEARLRAPVFDPADLDLEWAWQRARWILSRFRPALSRPMGV